MIKALKGIVPAFFIAVSAILLTACSGDLPASKPTLSSAYTPAVSPSPIRTPIITPTPLPTPVPTSEPPPEPVFTQPPYAEFDGSLPYWSMFYEHGPAMLAEQNLYEYTLAFDPAILMDLVGTHTGAEIKEALNETVWDNFMTYNSDERRWALSRSYQVEIGEAQTLYVSGELCETRTITVVDTNADSAPSDYAIGHTLYFICQNDVWYYPAQILHYKFVASDPQPLDDVADEVWFAQDAERRDVCYVLTNHRQTKNASWTRVDYQSLTKRTPSIGYYTNVKAQNDDGWRIETNAAFDYRTADNGVVHLTVRQDAFDPEGNPQCGVTHYIEYEWNDMGILERSSYRARFDDGYEVDYGATVSFYSYLAPRWNPEWFSGYTPVKVPDIPEDAAGLEKFFEPKTGARLYATQAMTTDNLHSMTPELAVDVLSNRCGAHRDAPEKWDHEEDDIGLYSFTLTLENVKRNAAWVTAPEYNGYSEDENFLFIEYDECWKLVVASDEDEYDYESPYIVQSPDGQTAWLVDGWNNGKRGDGYISWYNLVTGRIDVEYTSVYPDEAMYSTYEFTSVESLAYKPESNYDFHKGYPFVRVFDAPLVIKGKLRGFDGVAVYTDYKVNYTCDYEHTFVYAPETRSLAIQKRKIKTSEGFTYEESFRLPAEVAPRMTPHEIETRPPSAQELADVYMSVPTEIPSWYRGTSVIEMAPSKVENSFKPEMSYNMDEIIGFFEEQQEHAYAFEELIKRLEERRAPFEPTLRVWFEAYDERAFFEGEKIDVRVCEFFFYEPYADTDKIAYTNLYDSYRMYFFETDGVWRMTSSIWMEEWHTERTETMIVGHESGQCLWLVETPPHGTGTGFYVHDVIWRNLLTGNIDFIYDVHEYNYMETSEYDSLSALYGAYEKTMPDGQPMMVLADMIYIQTGHLLYDLENYVSETEHDKVLITQLHQTGALCFYAGRYPGYRLVSYEVDVPVVLRDNIVNRYGISTSGSCYGEGRAARFSCDR